jgi:hypothetical protein
MIPLTPRAAKLTPKQLSRAAKRANFVRWREARKAVVT